MIASIATALLFAAQAQVAQGETGYDQLMRGQDSAAIAVIGKERALAEQDPARLINLGIAYAHRGQDAEARAMFQAALASPERVELETATGEWIDSRWLARKALAMLDTGRLERGERVAAR